MTEFPDARDIKIKLLEQMNLKLKADNVSLHKRLNTSSDAVKMENIQLKAEIASLKNELKGKKDVRYL
jgi:hypothetical protein